MSTDDLCRIVETSAKAGVSELKFGDLHVKFGTPAETQVLNVDLSRLPNYPFVKQSPGSPLTDEQHRKQGEESLEADQIRLREDQLATALVEDPMRYEELLSQGELTDDVDSADDEDDE